MKFPDKFSNFKNILVQCLCTSINLFSKNQIESSLINQFLDAILDIIRLDKTFVNQFIKENLQAIFFTLKEKILFQKDYNLQELTNLCALCFIFNEDHQIQENLFDCIWKIGIKDSCYEKNNKILIIWCSINPEFSYNYISQKIFSLSLKDQLSFMSFEFHLFIYLGILKSYGNLFSFFITLNFYL